VKAVWRGGKRVVEDGRHLSAERIGLRYRQTLDKLLDT
jgi:hypothetical protein